VDLRQVEVTIQNLIGSGMDPKTENNPYLGFVYTSFQVGAGRLQARCRGYKEAKQPAPPGAQRLCASL
jgi:hypothetical protein